ncbi:MAG: NAD-glutamate dehydrogenase, partial [Microlunatus sp.]|nr:NAD-glutamate dehydrogenase [Microlunatus sp.]
MTTFEIDLERDKTGKIDEVAERGVAMGTEMGYDAESVRTFLGHYFRHVDAMDIEERSVEDLLGVVTSHYRLARQRPSARATIGIATPNQPEDGWTSGGATVVQIVTDDRPFLVDSVTMEVLSQGWSIREVYHPQFFVDRDLGGTLHGILTSAQASVGAGRRDVPDQPANVVAESWMHLEILPPSGQGHPEQLTSALEQGLREVLRLVEEAVEDWDKMQVRAQETIDLLTDPQLPADRLDEAEIARELMTWLADHHFTFLGYREYRVESPADARSTDGGSQDGAALWQNDRYLAVGSSGLGILRADADQPDAFHAYPTNDRPQLMVITKDNHKSRVHRPSYLDYVGIRLFDETGNVVGERRFLGLFSSTAYSEAVVHIPLLRQKASEVLRRSAYDESSHGGKAIIDVLDTYPRDELFQATVDELAPTVEKAAHLRERRQVRLFVRRDVYGRYLSCLVYLPRDRYTTAVRNRMQDILISRLGGSTVDFTARMTESVLARLHFVVRVPEGASIDEVDVRPLERELMLATRSWDDEFAELLSDSEHPDQLAALVTALPEGYKEDYRPHQAMLDLTALLSLPGDDDEVELAMYRPDRADDDANLRFKIFRWAETLSLSEIMPHLTLLGVDVIDERPYELAVGADRRAFVYDFGVVVPGGTEAVEKRWDNEARHQFMDAFAASYRGRSEPDLFNALVMGADLNWRQVGILRAIGRYLRQTGSTYSVAYVARALSANVDIARKLVELFETKFDPGLELSRADRADEVEDLRDTIKSALDSVASLDHDKIIRSYLAIIDAVIRTSFYSPDRQSIALKLLPRKIPDLPQPRPAYEIFVYAPRVEGVHLRFGSVARGGLRWSDRAEDFRTEVLGLVKAQMVKNTVIVPVGAKGGFYCKQLPDPGQDREAWLAEGKACYQIFIGSLLDLTDNIVDGEVIPPQNVVRYDGDDPYLVVAADKGTAAFSDIANAISIEHGFWLGDAFASGGSAGYDHKGMGITARGAWESVQRHFREMGIDTQTEDFTCVGIGDMSGDVFGNGMLLSEHIKLVAAFDHRHVVIDPDPDPAASWAERQRLFKLPRSSWADYDADLISAGGGIFPRTLKAVTITPEMHRVLGIDADVTELAPAELISACLRAPVDLVWNGGIGTYVKATAESHAQVGDKANDNLRVNGAEL